MGSGPSGACCCDRSAGGTAASPTAARAAATVAAAARVVAADAEAEAPPSVPASFPERSLFAVVVVVVVVVAVVVVVGGRSLAFLGSWPPLGRGAIGSDPVSQDDIMRFAVPRPSRPVGSVCLGRATERLRARQFHLFRLSLPPPLSPPLPELVASMVLSARGLRGGACGRCWPTLGRFAAQACPCEPLRSSVALAGRRGARLQFRFL